MTGQERPGDGEPERLAGVRRLFAKFSIFGLHRMNYSNCMKLKVHD